MHPSRCSECLDDFILRANNEHIHHVAGITLRIGNAARHLSKNFGGHRRNGGFRGTTNGSGASSGQSWLDDFDLYMKVSSGAGSVIEALVDAEKQSLRNGRLIV